MQSTNSQSISHKSPKLIFIKQFHQLLLCVASYDTMYSFSNCACTLKGKTLPINNADERMQYNKVETKCFFPNIYYLKYFLIFCLRIWIFLLTERGQNKCWRMTFKDEIMKQKKMQQTFKISNISFIDHIEIIVLLNNL